MQYLKLIKITLLFCTYLSALKVDFVLYNEPRRPTITHDHLSLLEPNKSTVFITHGWLGNAHSAYIEELASTYSKVGNYNIIIVDWSLESSLDYLTEVFFVVRLVGDRLGQLLLAMRQYGMQMRAIHLVGHSLGAHISGHAGRYVKKRSPKEGVYRITGLDAAGPLFTSAAFFTRSMRLRSTDAEIVDVTHTNGLFLGISEPLGTVDFFINDGLVQPICLNSLGPISFIVLNVCSHTLSTLYFNLSITSLDYKGSRNRRTCENLAVYGEHMDPSTRGIYYVRTQNVFPYKSVC